MHFTDNQAEDSSSSSTSSGPSLKSIPLVSPSHQWGALGDLKSLLRNLIKGPESVKELPPVPDIPALLTDSLHRVCGKPPGSLCTISQIVADVVHLFPVTNESKFMLVSRPPSLTYGLLSRVPSPKEARDKTKQATENKKDADSPGGASAEGQMKNEEAVVVRVVCHDPDKISSGQVWVSVCVQKQNGLFQLTPQPFKCFFFKCGLQIPSPLALEWNVLPHSKVRIKPVNSAVKVAFSVRLQPINPLVSSSRCSESAIINFLKKSAFICEFV